MKNIQIENDNPTIRYFVEMTLCYVKGCNEKNIAHAELEFKKYHKRVSLCKEHAKQMKWFFDNMEEP